MLLLYSNFLSMSGGTWPVLDALISWCFMAVDMFLPYNSLIPITSISVVYVFLRKLEIRKDMKRNFWMTKFIVLKFPPFYQCEESWKEVVEGFSLLFDVGSLEERNGIVFKDEELSWIGWKVVLSSSWGPGLVWVWDLVICLLGSCFHGES